MSDKERKDESWIRKLPTIIIVLAVLTFIIIVFRDHKQYIKWEENQTELTGRFEQTSEELAQLQKAQGSLQEVTAKAESLEQKVSDLTATLEKLHADKSGTETTITRLRQELDDMNGRILSSRNELTELTKETEAISNTNQQLRIDIFNKERVLDSVEFLQRQKPALEQNIQDLKKRTDLAVKEELEQQSRLAALQNEIKEAEAAIQTQMDQRATLNKELSELQESVTRLSSQKEKLEILADHQQKVEYLKYLQKQKESLEMTINDLLERGKELEEKNLQLQQQTPPQ